MRSMVMSGVLLLALQAAFAAGPTIGEQAPPLHVNAVNDGEQGTYEVVEAAQGSTLVLYFVDLFAAEEPEQQQLGGALNRFYQQQADKGLKAVVVVAGGDQYVAELQSFCEVNQIKLPVAPLGYVEEDFKAWNMDATLKNMLVVIQDGKVVEVLGDVTSEKLAEAGPRIAGLLGDGTPPPLKIDAVNDGERPEYEVVEDAAGEPLVLFFLDMFAAEDPAQQAVGGFLSQIYAAYHDQGLHAAIIVPGADQYVAELKQYCEANQAIIPVAAIGYNDEQFKAWKMAPETKNMLVVIKDGKLIETMRDVTIETLQAALPRLSAKLKGEEPPK